MRKRIGIRILGPMVAVVVGATLAGSDLAVAHTRTFRTSLTLAAKRHTVKAGSPVQLFGNLSSGKDRCKSNQTIEVFRDGSSIGSTTTSGTGHYKFTDPAPATGTHQYQSKFAGSTFGTPPKHQHNCAASESNTVKVNVVT